jgi:hypothetical protein
MDDKGTIRRLANLIIAMVQQRKSTRPMLRESQRLSRAPSHTGNPTVGTRGAFGGPDRRKRLVNGQVLDQSKTCAKAGRRGGKADPRFGLRVGELG